MKLIIDGYGTEREVAPEVPRIEGAQFEKRDHPVMEEWFAEAQRRQEIRESVEPTYNYAKYEMTSSTPLFLGVTGDWHLGARVNHQDLLRDVKIMAEHPLVGGVFFMGDLTDSAFFNPAQDEDHLSYEEQRRMMMSILERIGWNRALAFWKGNHDHKWERKTGLSKYQEIADRSGKPVFYGPAFVEIVLNGITYRFMGSHVLKGNSIYNFAHPAVRGHKETNGVDIVMGAHTHKRANLSQPVREYNGARDTLSVMSGTYQKGSEYGLDNGMPELYPEEQGMYWIMLGHQNKHFLAMRTPQMLEIANQFLVVGE